jgi:hypothetical protein
MCTTCKRWKRGILQHDWYDVLPTARIHQLNTPSLYFDGKTLEGRLWHQWDVGSTCLGRRSRWSADERPTWYRVSAAGCTPGCHVGSIPPKPSPSLLLFELPWRILLDQTCCQRTQRPEPCIDNIGSPSVQATGNPIQERYNITLHEMTAVQVLLVSSSVVSACTLVSRAGHNGVLGCPFC